MTALEQAAVATTVQLEAQLIEVNQEYACCPGTLADMMHHLHAIQAILMSRQCVKDRFMSPENIFNQ